MTLPPDPFVLGILCVLVGAFWWIWIGVRTRKAHVLEILGIIALGLLGIGLYVGTALLMLFAGAH